MSDKTNEVKPVKYTFTFKLTDNRFAIITSSTSPYLPAFYNEDSPIQKKAI